MMEKAQRVCNYYVLAVKLKDVIRKGYINVCVSRERMESVAEHVYGTLNLAIAMYYTYGIKVDLAKVLLMLSIHEVEEIKIGDVAMTDPNYEEAKKEAKKAVKEVFSCFEESEVLENLIEEFDKRETDEAIFAYLCDKLECDLYVKVLSEEENFDIEALKKKDNYFSRKIVNGDETLAEIWLPGDEDKFKDHEYFREVFEYARDHKILKKVGSECERKEGKE